jgi:cellulose synthase/poly-beta-1,6-N-acetylglucosamine synthase-like glycosyltransferase
LSIILSSWTFLSERSFIELCGLFWFVILLDIPRYFLGFLAVFITGSVTRRAQSPIIWPGTASVLIAGHNEAVSFERCVRSLRQQTRKNIEIICVDDGSTDGTGEVLRRLFRHGLIDVALSVKDRGGKSAALNLAASLAKGDALVVVDCDCTFEEHAIERLLAPLNNKAVGAVAAAVLVRNASNSVVASLQGLEYLFSIYLGRTLQDYFGLVTCVSGAMGAFRRSAWRQVGGMDVGPGEDLDITFRLRQKGYAMRFAGPMCRKPWGVFFDSAAGGRGTPCGCGCESSVIASTPSTSGSGCERRPISWSFSLIPSRRRSSSSSTSGISQRRRRTSC